jgi:hypothetical protein
MQVSVYSYATGQLQLLVCMQESVRLHAIGQLQLLICTLAAYALGVACGSGYHRSACIHLS